MGASFLSVHKATLGTSGRWQRGASVLHCHGVWAGEGHVFEAWQLHLEATLEIGAWKGANLGAMEVRDT